MSSSWTFFLLNLTEVTSTQNLFTDSRVDVTSVNFNRKKVYELISCRPKLSSS